MSLKENYEYCEKLKIDFFMKYKNYIDIEFFINGDNGEYKVYYKGDLKLIEPYIDMEIIEENMGLKNEKNH